MTVQRCDWCGVRFETSGGPGRPARYCRRSHRQRHYEARREAERLGITGVVVSHDGWEALRDALYRLEAGWDDTRADVADGDLASLVSFGDLVAEVLAAVPEPLARP